MSALAPSMSLIANAAPMPQASPTAAPADNGFARCLDHARECEATFADEAPQRPGANEAPQRPGAKKPTPNTKADRSGREPGAARAAAPDGPPPKQATEANADAEAGTADTAHGDGTAAAPDLAALLPGWTPPPAAATASSAVAPAAEDGARQPACSAVAGAKASAMPPRDEHAVRALAQLAAAPAAAGANDKSAPASFASSADLQAAASEQRNAAPDLPSAALSAPLHGAPAAAPALPLAAALKAVEAPPPTATVPAPIDSPAFAPALATQLRWWAHDGVQQAQLLLNPAEMGPVAVKIVLDGREARIDFSADLAATRGAIEAALPVLAAALDDGGMKLAGGGVHDGSAQRQPEWSARGVTHRTGSSAAARDDDRTAAAAATRGAPSRGIVDLVA